MRMTTGELASWLGGELEGDPAVEIAGVASLESAAPDRVVFVDSEKLVGRALASAAGAVILGRDVVAAGKPLIRVDHPKGAFARTVARFLPELPLVRGRHATAVVDATAVVAPSAALAPHVVVGAGARVGADCQIGAGCVIGEEARIGEGSILFPGVVIYRGVGIGRRVRIHSGAVVGSDGFGNVKVEGRWEKFPQRGAVHVGDDVEIGAGTTIDRGALDDTIIGRGTKIDNLVHVGHNVVIGEDCALAAQVGIAGSARIGDRVLLAGKVGIADYATIESDAVLLGATVVGTGKTIRRGQVVSGNPARPHADAQRIAAHLARLPRLADRLAALEKQAGDSG